MRGGWWISGRARAFGRARGGNVAMMWALLGAMLVGLVGITVDFTRAQAVRAQMQNAVDGAALFAARAQTVTVEERVAAARAYYEAEMGRPSHETELTITELPNNQFRVEAQAPMPLTLARLVSNRNWTVRTVSEAERGGVNIEVAMVLDVTGSMSGSRITNLRAAAADLIDIVVRVEQEPFYSRAGIVPYSNSVNVGPLAAQVRGDAPPGRAITGAAWANGAGKAISGITRANPAVVTANNHGFSNGDTVYITGVGGMTQVNNNVYTISNVAANSFRLVGVNSSSYSNYSSGGTVTRCLAASCNVVVTSNNHGFANNDRVFITGVNGMTQINNGANSTWQVNAVTANTFALAGSNGPSYNAYTNGGQAFCTTYGCQYFRFNNANNGAERVHMISTCVSERTGAQRYTDAAPGAAPVGIVYPPPAATGNGCLGDQITPLTADRALLTQRANSLQIVGSTAGQIGMAWGWYLIAPNWSHLWPSSQIANYNAPRTVKIVVLMTDGEFNTPYCNGVIAANAGSGSGAAADHINCNATNGDPFAQTAALCTAMKQQGVIIYTVGFEISNSAAVTNMLANCATSPNHAFMASGGEQLRSAFRQIANSISQLRLTR